MLSKNIPHREEYIKKRRQKRLKKYGLLVIFFILIVAVSSYVSHRQELRISKVILSGGVLLTEETISKESLSFLQGSYVWLFPKDNIFWYPKNSLEKHLASVFPRIDTIKVKLDAPNILVVTVEERKPIAMWCNKDLNIETSDPNKEDCYFMDQNSVVFGKAPVFSGNAYFKYYGILDGNSPIGKSYMASTTLFSEISDFVSFTKNQSLKPEYLVANSNDDFSLFLQGGGVLYFDTKYSIDVIKQNLVLLLEKPGLQLNANNQLPVEYIDMRYGNKLFYKLRSDN